MTDLALQQDFRVCFVVKVRVRAGVRLKARVSFRVGYQCLDIGQISMVERQVGHAQLSLAKSVTLVAFFYLEL